MFRALLWKEWRELWILPAVAVPLALMSFIVTNAAFRQTTSVVWGSSFAVWLLIAAVDIPTHLYVRERETCTIEFLSARPLDRFRLWWVWLFAGVATLTAIGVTLFVVTNILGLLFYGGNSFGHYSGTVVTASAAAALILYSLSSFFSAFFKKQLSAIAGVIIVVAFLWALWAIREYIPYPLNLVVHISDGLRGSDRVYDVRLLNKFYFTLYEYRSSPLTAWALILCPALLLSSLAVFAKGNLKSPSSLISAYWICAVIAIAPMALGFSNISFMTGIRHRSSSNYYVIVENVSEDGNRLVLRTGPEGIPVSLNLQDRRLYRIEPSMSYPCKKVKGERILFTKRRGELPSRFFPKKLVLADFHGEWTRELFTEPWIFRRGLVDHMGDFSTDGRYLAVPDPPNDKTGKDGLLKIFDRDGNLIGEHVLPLAGGVSVGVLGWDDDSRLYFTRPHRSEDQRRRCWRISPADMIPEEVVSVSEQAHWYDRISPDGRWLLTARPSEGGKRGREYDYRVYDIDQNTFHFVAKNIKHYRWSPDDTKLAYAIRTDPPLDVKTKRRLFSKIMVFEPETGARYAASPEAFWKLELKSWSPSGKYILLSHYGHTESSGQDSVSAKTRWFSALSIETLEITEITKPTTRPDYEYLIGHGLRWITGDKLLWRDKNKLIATEYDGSNPQEIFRVKDGTFYLYGEEAG
jgi:ABC-type transport system involved in multi-copper enzyme maturation permease subunit